MFCFPYYASDIHIASCLLDSVVEHHTFRVLRLLLFFVVLVIHQVGDAALEHTDVSHPVGMLFLFLGFCCGPGRVLE